MALVVAWAQPFESGELAERERNQWKRKRAARKGQLAVDEKVELAV